MKYLNTETNQYPITEADIRAANPNTSFPTPFAAPEVYAPVFAAPPPSYDTITHTIQELAPVLTDKGHYEQAWEVVALPEEVAADNIAARAEADVKLVENKIEALWQAADKYTRSYISGVAIGILTIGVLQEKPKAQAVSAWSSSVWAEYYARKALVTPTGVDNLDFSSFGPIPYSVPELQAEVGL